MHNLYCTPLGESIRTEFVRRIAAEEDGNGRQAIYLLPSIYLLDEARQTLRAIGKSHARLMLFDDLVVEIVRGAGGGQQIMSSLKRQLVMEEVLNELAEADRLPYFSAIRSFPGYVGNVSAMITEIKRSGASPEEFALAMEAAADARGIHPRDCELCAIYEFYQKRLTDYNLADMEEMYFLAIDMLQSGWNSLPYRHIYISEFDIFTPLQLEVVRQLRSFCTMDIGIMYEKNRPALFQAVEPTYASLVGSGFQVCFVPPKRDGAGDLRHIRENLFNDNFCKIAANGLVELVSTPHLQKEMAVVAGKIKKIVLDGQFSLEEIAVVVRDKDRYAGLIKVFADYKLPLNMPSSERVAQQPLFYMVAALMEAILAGGTRETVLNALKSPFIAKAFDIDADKVEKMAQGMVIRGWQDWLNVSQKLGETGNSLGKFCEYIRAWTDYCSSVEWPAKLRSLLKMLQLEKKLGEGYKHKEFGLNELKINLITLEALEELIKEIENDFIVVGQQKRVLSLTDFLAYFRQAATKKNVTLAKNSAGIRVLTPAEARGALFPAVFILGLAEGEFPRREKDSWLLEERERSLLKELGIEIMTAPFRRAEENLYFAAAVGMAEQFAVISCREDAEVLPSPYVDEIKRLFVPETLPEKRFTVSDIFPEDYREVYAVSELVEFSLNERLSKGKNTSETSAAAGFTLTELVDGDFLRRVTAEAERLEGKDCRFDGAISSAVLLEKIQGKHYSITALEAYGLCPFHYFATRILNLDEWQEKEEETRIDIIGTLYHDTLTAFMRQYIGTRLKEDNRETYYQQLVFALDDSAKRLIAKEKIISGKWWEYRREHILKALRRWLAVELKEQSSEGLAFTPAWLEWGFGMPRSEGMDEVSTDTPLKIEIEGKCFEIAGKVDRIDRAGETLVVVDYKRKSCPQYSDLENGMDLQAALYIMAVEKLLCPIGGQVAGGGYYSIEGSKKEGGMWRLELARDIGHRAKKSAGNLDEEEFCQMQQQVGLRVKKIIDGIEKGRFRVKPTQDCPTYCLAREICRVGQIDRSEENSRGEYNG
ncbi:MAG: addB [Firmicutes bacterium]|nr:addB [Bacillota bacterium]